MFDSYCFFMVFLDEDLIFSGILSDTSNPTHIISVFDKKIPWPYTRIND